MQLIVDNELEEFIKPLHTDEFEALTLSIKANGCIEPIIVWNQGNGSVGTIVDGHNRYAICQQYNIPFKTVKIKFNDKLAVMTWMFNKQKGRRNLTPVERLELHAKLRDYASKYAKERMLAGKKVEEVGENVLASRDARFRTKGKVLEKIAKEAEVSVATAERYDAIQRKGTDEQKEAVRTGQKKIGTVYKEIQVKEKPSEKAQDNNWNIYELFRNKFADKYLQGKYILIHDIKINDTSSLGYLSNCNDYEQIKRHADSIMGMISVICDKEDISNLKSALQKVISKFVIQKVEQEEESDE